MNKIRKWMTWKRFWTIHGCIQMIIWLDASFLLKDFYLAYISALAAMAFFGIAQCKKEDEKKENKNKNEISNNRKPFCG